MSITSQTLFYHTLRAAGFKSETACKQDYELRLTKKNKLDEQSKNRDYHANYFRLNATSPDHLRELLEEKAKEFYNIDLKFTKWDIRYGWVSNSHSAPIGEKTNFDRNKSLPLHHLGFSGHAEGTCVFPKDFPLRMNSAATLGFSDFVGMIRGFHTQSGSSGRYFCMGANFFISDYPLITAKHEKFLAYRDNYTKENREYQNLIYHNGLLCNKLLAENSEAIRIQRKIVELREQIAELNRDYLTVIDIIKNENPVVFTLNYPANKCEDIEIFGKLA